MTDDQARKLSTRIIDTWPNGPKAYVWHDLVLELEPGPAAGAYRQLVRNDNGRTPTTGQFMAEYRRLNQPEGQQTGTRWTGTEISLDQYLERLAVKAKDGSRDAADELENWNRWLTRKDTA